MSDAKYLPGDRVFNHLGKPATVVEPRGEVNHSLNGPYVDLHVDSSPGANVFANTHIDNLSRQLIEAGCWVRSIAKPEIKHKIMDVFGRIGYIASNRMLDLSCFVRIADPQPVPATTEYHQI